jgi:protoheme IX farnesyltransferase
MFFGTVGAVYSGSAVVLGGTFVVLAMAVLRDVGETAARRMFGFSILYLFLLFAALIAERTLVSAGTWGGYG